MSRRRTLHPEEQELWRSVARTAKPMHRRVSLLSDPVKPPVADFVAKPAPLAPFRVGQANRMGSTAQFVPSVSESLASAPLQMDAKTHAKMTRGKLMPQARIDLHGMTLDQAHPALNNFIAGASSAGLRLVLVITGKGKIRNEAGAAPQRTGVLRQQVPQWLRMRPLSALVLQVTEAHGSHGGGGALYVYLRRR